MTRAKQVLVMSGSEGARRTQAVTWYRRIEAAMRCFLVAESS